MRHILAIYSSDDYFSPPVSLSFSVHFGSRQADAFAVRADAAISD